MALVMFSTTLMLRFKVFEKLVVNSRIPCFYWALGILTQSNPQVIHNYPQGFSACFHSFIHRLPGGGLQSKSRYPMLDKF